MKKSKLFGGILTLCLCAGLIFGGCSAEEKEPIGKDEIPPVENPSGGDTPGNENGTGGTQGTPENQTPSGGENSTAVVSSVTVSSASLKLVVGDEPVKLGAIVNGTNLSDSDKEVTWTSQNESVVKVADDGTVTVIGKGSTRVVATSKKDAAKSNHCAVSVEDVNGSTAYNFDYSTLGNFSDGTTALYNTSIKYYNDAVYAYYNASSGSALRIRTSGGVNTAFNYNGENTTTKDAVVGGTVAEGSSYVGIDLSKLSLVSENVKVEFSIAVNGSTNDKASDTGILYLVNKATGKVIAMETGLKTKSGNDTRTVSVDVAKTTDVRVFFSRNGSGGGGIDITSIKVIDENASASLVRPTSITLNKTSASLTMTDDEVSPAATLTATVLPANVTSGYGTVSWISTDTGVATVSGGVVKAVGAGSATIIASTSNGKTATASVSVADNRTAKYISKDDKPLGFAQIDVSKMTKGAVTVTNKADFVSKVQAGGYIVYVDGKIDLSDGMMPTSAGGTSTALDNFVKTKTNSDYTSYKTFIDEYTKSCSKSTDHKANPTSESTTYANCKSQSDANYKYWTLWFLNRQYGNAITVKPASNTMIIGLPGAEVYGGRININSVNNVAIRNLTIRDAYDPFPHHEKDDGFNAEHDCIVIQGTSYNIWIDHCTMKDSYHCVNAANGEKFQTYDGLCDMKNDTKNLTVSYCRLQDHDKTMLIGSSATDGSNATRTITLHHNYFLNCGQRLPMVRNTRLHNFNNYYDTDANKYWGQSYAVGIRENVLCVSENNYFGSGIQYSYKDSEGLLYKNGDVDKSSKKCNTTTLKTKMSDVFTPTYTYNLDDASTLNTFVPANAGAGVWTVKK